MNAEDPNLRPDNQAGGNPEGEHETPENDYENIEHVVSGEEDYFNMCEGKNGMIVYGTYTGEGYKEGDNRVNEDAQVINTNANGFASIDGMSGMRNAKLAAQILAEEIQKGFQENIPMEEAQKNAHLRMEREGVGNGGACYIAGKINGNKLDIYQAGDVRLIVIDKDGKIKFETSDEGVGNRVYNAVGGKDPGETTHLQVSLEEGDRIVTASDGLWDNLKSDQVAEIVTSNLSCRDAYWTLQNAAVNEMVTSETGKPDNINIIIYEYEKAAPGIPDTNLEQLLRDLDLARQQYARAKFEYDKEVKETRKRKESTIDVDDTEYKEAQKHYEALLHRLRQAMSERAKQEVAVLPDDKKEAKLQKKMEEILINTVVKESDRVFDEIQRVKFETHPHETFRNIKNSLFSIVDTYRKIPLKYKFGFSGLLLAGGVAAGLGAVTAPAALTGLFIGATTQRMLGGASTGISTEAGLKIVQNWLDKRRLLKEFKGDPLQDVIKDEHLHLNQRLDNLVGKKQKQKYIRYGLAAIVGGSIMLGLPRKVFGWLELGGGGAEESATGPVKPQHTPSQPPVSGESPPITSGEGGGSRLTAPRPPDGFTPSAPEGTTGGQSSTVGEEIKPKLTGPRIELAPDESTGAAPEEGSSMHPELNPSSESSSSLPPKIGPETSQVPNQPNASSETGGLGTKVKPASPWESPASKDFSAVYNPDEGGSVWKGLRQKLIERYGIDFTSLPKGRRIFIINELKNYVEANHGEFGLDNVHRIEKGQPIDFSKIFDEKDGIASKTLKKAMDLSEERVHKIEDYAKAASVRKTIEEAMAAGTEEVVKTEVPAEVVPENIPKPSVSSAPPVSDIPVPKYDSVETTGSVTSPPDPNFSPKPSVPEIDQDAFEHTVSLKDQERLGKMIDDQKLKEAELELTQLDPTAPVHFSGELIGTLKEIGFSNEQFLTFIRKGVTVEDIMDKNSLPREGGWKFWQNGSFNHAVKQLQTYIEVHGTSAEQPGVLSEGVRNMKIKDFMDQAIAGQRLY